MSEYNNRIPCYVIPLTSISRITIPPFSCAIFINERFKQWPSKKTLYIFFVTILYHSWFSASHDSCESFNAPQLKQKFQYLMVHKLPTYVLVQCFPYPKSVPLSNYRQFFKYKFPFLQYIWVKKQYHRLLTEEYHNHRSHL